MLAPSENKVFTYLLNTYQCQVSIYMTTGPLVFILIPIRDFPEFLLNVRCKSVVTFILRCSCEVHFLRERGRIGLA